MTEYTNQFAKFNLPATQLGWKKEDTLALFSEFTKNVSPNYAGLYTQQIARLANTSVTKGYSFAIQQKRAGKSAADFGITGEDFDRLTSMPVSDYANFFVDKKTGKMKGAVEMIQGIKTAYDKFSNDAAKNAFL